ncbi:MAG TPA: helix-turn-helix transcriptional regulator [Pyrinomonadaceae bacterium]|nr:helix-turn-helix transcriptional regulator [Pyrinomonadaceae bacterium]
MGYKRPRPRRMASKLREIREKLELSQSQMLARLDLKEKMHYGRISQYENDEREPSLITVLAYAHVAGVHLEDIVSDDLDLPSKIPGNVNYQGLRHKPTRRK